MPHSWGARLAYIKDHFSTKKHRIKCLLPVAFYHKKKKRVIYNNTNEFQIINNNNNRTKEEEVINKCDE